MSKNKEIKVEIKLPKHFAVNGQQNIEITLKEIKKGKSLRRGDTA